MNWIDHIIWPLKKKIRYILFYILPIQKLNDQNINELSSFLLLEWIRNSDLRNIFTNIIQETTKTLLHFFHLGSLRSWVDPDRIKAMRVWTFKQK